jgi:tRNA nucleotidyltransferase (CCA-adding enzyme)
MADYIYLLQTRLTAAQQQALTSVRDVARSKGMTIFLVGGAVRDLTTGSPVRDLDVVLQGNALKLKKELQNAKLTLVGESAGSQSLYFSTPGGVRLEVGSTLSITFPKPGKPVAKPANILDDLRRRDFTANAMAISLNDGSYGLLMDPLNGIADIENRELRLVSPYGFIEDPVRMIRATRLSARLGFQMEEKTQQRYETGKAEGYISALSSEAKSYETEEIFHEEDPLRVLRRLESEGWMKALNPAVQSSKTNENELNKLRDMASQLESMGLFADPSAAYFPLLTAKMAPKDVATLKSSFARQGFVEQIENLDAETKDFNVKFTNKAAVSPSETWKLLMSSVPEHVLALAYTSKSAPVQARFQAFFHESSQARQRIPYQTLQEMRITPDLPIYPQLIEDLFFALMDKKLETPEATKAFLEPFSPPAPPPPVSLRRRVVKRETKVSKRSKKAPAPTVSSPDETNDDAPEAMAKPAESQKTHKTPAAKEPSAGSAVTTAKAASPAKAAAVKPPAAKAVPSKTSSTVTNKTAAKVPAKIAPKVAPAKAAPDKATPAKAAPAKTVAAKPAAAKKPLPVTAKKSVPSKSRGAVKQAPRPAAKKQAVKVAARPSVQKKTISKPAAKNVAKAVKPAAKKPVAVKKNQPQKTAAKKIPSKKTAVKTKRR